MQAFSIAVLVAILAAWPLVAWMLGSICAHGPAAPLCGHCAYDRSGIGVEDPCPECGLTIDEAARALAPPPTWRRRVGFIAVTLVGVAAVIFNYSDIGGCLVVLCGVAYLSVILNASVHMERRDYRMLQAHGWLAAAVFVMGWLLWSSGRAGHILQLIVVASAGFGVGAAVSSVRTWRRLKGAAIHSR